MTLTSGSDGRFRANDNSDVGEPNLWLTDAIGTKYSVWTSFWEKEGGSIAFEIPEGVNGLAFHDGNHHAYPIKPAPAPAPLATVAGAK